MKLDTITALAVTLYSASCVVAEALQVAAVPTSDSASVPSALPESDVLSEAFPKVELVKEKRQQVAAGGGAAAATTAAMQVPTVTTFWQASSIAGVPTPTYLEVIFTQTFASVPDQWPQPGSGSVGYGTLAKSKRDVAMPVTALAARATVTVTEVERVLVMAMETIEVLCAVRPITVVSIVQTATVIRYVSAGDASPFPSNHDSTIDRTNRTAHATGLYTGIPLNSAPLSPTAHF